VTRSLRKQQLLRGEVPPDMDPKLARRSSAYHRRAPGGPGTELTGLFTSIGFDSWHGCKCEKRARLMDKWRAAGCRRRRAEIVAWLRETATRTSWTAKLLKAPKAATIIPAIHWVDPIPWLVDEAIRRSEA
jgi:hypothetical protein